jgi:hypothetical protein
LIIITNDQLWEQTNKIKTTEQITRRKWNWIGHTLRKENAIEKEAMEWNSQGQRRRRVGREQQHERKPWLLGRHGEKLNNSARTVWDGDILLMLCAPVGAKGR